MTSYLRLAFVLGWLAAVGGCHDSSAPSSDRVEIPTIDTRKILNSSEYKKAVADAMALQEKEEKIREEAPWIGKTGLKENVERELPQYLRREFGQTIFDKGSLKASNLLYEGRFDEKGEEIHYWKIAYEKETSYAYVIIRGRSTTTGWGDRSPPRQTR
jgi:hypothetical protein